jgi:predicted O-methyltransferase YrrM
LKKFIKKIPLANKIIYACKLFLALKKNHQICLPGHFHSPIPDLEEVRKRQEQIFSVPDRNIPGIELNEKEQFQLLRKLVSYYKEIPFGPCKKPTLRYYFENSFYSYSDAIFLYLIIRHMKPKKIIEIGSGYSTALILDINELFFENKISCVIIEPYPSRLYSLLMPKDKERILIFESKLQNIDLDIFNTLSNNDILFIDSSHVSKIGSDVNRIFFEVLPMLNSGVLIHFHDVIYPFEYPKKHIFNGNSWNEAYLLRSFLQFNKSFKIILFNTFLEYFYEEFFIKNLDHCLKNKGGSIWLKKI